MAKYYYHQVSARLSEDDYNAFVDLAEKEGLSLANLARKCITTYLKGVKKAKLYSSMGITPTFGEMKPLQMESNDQK